MKRIVAAAAIAALTVTSLTACRSSGNGDTKTKSGSSNSSSTVKISVILPTGTSGQNWDPALHGAQAAVKSINAAGGVKGHKLAIDYCNEQNDTNAAAKCARSAESGSDVATLSLFSTFASQSVLPNFKTIPDIGPMALSPGEISCATCYAYDAWMFGTFGAGAALAKQTGIKSVTSMGQDIPISHNAVQQTTTALKALSIPSKSAIFIPPTASDMGPYAQKLVQSGGQAVNPLISHDQVYALMQALQQLGHKVVMIGNDNELNLADIKALGSYMNGSNFVLGMPPTTAAAKITGVRKWSADMKAAGYTAASDLGSASEHAWLGVQAISEIVGTISGTVDRTSFVKALKSAKGVNLFGIMPNWTPSAKAPAGAAKGMVNPYVYFSRVSNGQFVLVNQNPWNLAANKFEATA